MRLYSAVPIFASSAFVLVGCANPLNQGYAARYHQWGMQAEEARNYQLAERNYERAFINARLGRSPDAGVSMTVYNLGRVKGYLCKYEDAERLLTEALRLEEGASGPDSRLVSMRLFELARLHYDRGQHGAAIPYFSRGFEVARRLGAESKDPIGLADALDDYAAALERLGDSAKADAQKEEARRLRAIHPGRIAVYVPVRYNQPCPVVQVKGPQEEQTAVRAHPAPAEMSVVLRLRWNPLDRELAALQLVELNGRFPPRNLVSNSEFRIEPGLNRLGLRASALDRFFPTQVYVQRYICVDFEAQQDRVYTVSVGSHKRDWIVSLTTDGVEQEVSAKVKQLPFDGQNLLPCR